MPLFHEEPPGTLPTVVVSGSIAVELDWTMAAAWRPEFKRDHAVLGKAYEEFPELGQRVRAFWLPDEVTSCGGSIELMILAHHGGLLFSLDPEELLGRLEELCANAPTDLRLASETPADREALLRRLNKLRSSPEARRGYVRLVRDVWSAVSADWERDGLLAVNISVAARHDLQRRGAPWREVANTDMHCDQGRMNELVAGATAADTIAIVPAFFAHLGSLVDLPGTVLIGVRADGSAAQARARTELLARRLKTISDPTRLAMLVALGTSPQTVSDLASHFSLAQPTVSNHVKILREAGLVSSGSNGDRRRLTVQPDVLSDLLEHLEAMFRFREHQPAS
ncbi:MAG TPA: metalloregulator ArsR/SmtB family transcription factor [Acidimicrobiales bacterium]|nr:metalloregulator ArsR/SmtB family transcription factor [Acidimicrobiales bacterium]